MKLKRNLKTKKDREYWAFVEKTAKEVSKWPKWKRGIYEKETKV